MKEFGGDLIEELGEHLRQDTVPAGKHKNQGREQPSPGPITVPTSIPVAQIWGQARLDQFLSATGRAENQDRVQDRPSWAVTAASSHLGL